MFEVRELPRMQVPPGLDAHTREHILLHGHKTGRLGSSFVTLELTRVTVRCNRTLVVLDSNYPRPGGWAISG